MSLGILIPGDNDFVHFLDLDTFSSVRRPKQSSVIWKKKGSSNTSNVDFSSVSHSKLNKDVKRYSRKDLLSYNNSHLGETSCAYVCNDAMNVSCNSRSCDSFDENNLFIFDDESVRISPVSKMPFRKKPRDSLNVRSKHNSNQSLSRTVHRWLPKVQLLAEPIAKWIPKVKHYPDLSLDHRFRMFKAYDESLLCQRLRTYLFSVGQFCDKGLEVDFRKSTCFVRNKDGVDFLTGDRSSNLYTISLNEGASNSSTCLLAKASSSQSWLWHQRLSHLNFATINNLVKNNLVQGLPKMKFEKDHLCFACKQGKIHRKNHKSKTDFALNKPLYLLHMDLCDEASEVIISFIKKTQVNLQLLVQCVRTDNSSEFKNKTLAKFFDETGNWDDYICLVEFAYNNSWHASIKCAPFEMLYGRKCRAPICWDQVGERVIEGPEMIEVTNARVAVAKEKLKEARTRQKSYADKHRRALEFQTALPPQLSHVHDVFHVSLLRGYKYHPLHVITYPLDQIRTDLSYAEEPEAIIDRQDRIMRKKTIPFVKILWRNHSEREATWETEESIWTSYPHFLL
uniref:GAG-pre-integrase domain-containing protein n=1 Tax=Tanacetum cinerariifolium TaxID=118510 RepID=A0A6L2N2G8_TANCI|nr:hypothetical protein [Tanacetum cinerariifolium]